MDAVVIGQGAAGLAAALVLSQEGVGVTSISKTQPGKATCTVYAGGGFTWAWRTKHSRSQRRNA